MSYHRRRVFSLSLGDWLDPEVPIEWLAEMLDVIRRCQNLDWLLLTKRPELWDERMTAVQDAWPSSATIEATTVQMVNEWQDGRPPRNVWLGVSVENQATSDERIPKLLQIPSKVRFVSYEPALEAVDFHLWKSGIQHRDDFTGNPSDPTWMDQVTWVIVGGESGPQARPFNIEWARSTIAQCKEAGVACFVKQMGNDIRYGPNNTVPPEKFHDNKGGDMDEWPEDLRVREWPSTQHQVEAIP